MKIPPASGHLVRIVLNLRSAACAALLCTVATLGCRKPMEKTPAAADISGTYRLVSAGGKPVPAMLKHGHAELKVLAGEFTIQSDGNCRSLMEFVPPNGKTVTREVTATFTRSGNELFMTWKGAGRTRGQVEGTRFSMNNEGTLFVYDRQAGGR